MAVETARRVIAEFESMQAKADDISKLAKERLAFRLSRFFGTILFLAYLVIGVVVAATHHYFNHLGSVKPIISAVLVVVLWPLILFGVNLHIK